VVEEHYLRFLPLKTAMPTAAVPLSYAILPLYFSTSMYGGSCSNKTSTLPLSFLLYSTYSFGLFLVLPFISFLLRATMSLMASNYSSANTLNTLFLIRTSLSLPGCCAYALVHVGYYGYRICPKP